MTFETILTNLISSAIWLGLAYAYTRYRKRAKAEEVRLNKTLNSFGLITRKGFDPSEPHALLFLIRHLADFHKHWFYTNAIITIGMGIIFSIAVQFFLHDRLLGYENYWPLVIQAVFILHSLYLTISSYNQAEKYEKRITASIIERLSESSPTNQ